MARGKGGFNLFDEPAAAVPTIGVVLFFVILIMLHSWFWLALAVVSAMLLINAG